MFNKLTRIGRDAELRHTPSGKAVIGLACVYDVGWGDNKRPQWLEAVIWGKQAEALAQYLKRGNQVVIYADDLEIETYQKREGGEGFKLKCRVINLDLVSNGSQSNSTVTQQQAPQQQPTQADNGFNDSFDDDIPF